MKTAFYLFTILAFASCGNNQQQSSVSNTVYEKDSIVEEVVSVAPSRNYQQQPQRTIEKTFEVVADAYSVNETTMNMNSRGKYTLKVTLYSDHSADAVGREGVAMQVVKSTQDDWDFMCTVYGSGSYIYFFNTDEIYLSR